MDVIASTLVVAASWAFVGLVLVGCGGLTRRALLVAAGSSWQRSVVRADLWLGLGVVLAYLQLWSLSTGVGWQAWILPLAAGGTGLVVGGRRLDFAGHVVRTVVVVAGGFVAVLWVANRALGQARDYDLGLYHLDLIAYAAKFGTVPGLANLQTRLGAGDAHLVFVAFLDHGPWAGAGFHLANGLLVTMLFADVCWRFARRPAVAGPAPLSARMALLLVPATIAVIGLLPMHRLSSPNLDLATFVLVAIGALYLAEAIEREVELVPVFASAAAFAAASVTRPLYWVPTVLSIGLSLVAARRTKTGVFSGRGALAVLALPVLLLAGWMARQSILSGYPLFPTTLARLPVDWRVPADVVENENRWVFSWARLPGKAPDEVLGSWDWLGPWLDRRRSDRDVLFPLALLAALAPSLLSRRPEDVRGRRSRTAPMLAVIGPAVATLVIWFLTAPDPRFALAPLWLVPIGLAAWALPDLRGAALVTTVALAAVAAWALAGLLDDHARWFVPNVVGLWSGAAVLVAFLARGRPRAWLAYLALGFVALLPLAIVSDLGAFDVVRPSHVGPLGTQPPGGTDLVPFVTASGLRLWQPPDSGDQCWGVLMCTPSPQDALRLRGDGISDGFSVGG